MKKTALLLIMLLVFVNKYCCAQHIENDIKKTIDIFFDGMRKSDSSLINKAIIKDVALQSVLAKKDGSTFLLKENVNDFIKQVITPHAEIYDERITINDIKIDGSLAIVWAPYKFYLGHKLSHCGTDVFQLIKTQEGWKIFSIADTRRKEKCE